MQGFNLLPWREQLREERKKQFFYALSFSILSAIIIIFLAHLSIGQRIDSQTVVNEYLKSEIKSLDTKIAEVKNLQTQKKQLLERRDIIQRLQVNRTQVVHLYESLVKALPEGLYLATVKRKGDIVVITGKAESHTRISDFMRNINTSEWLKNANLKEIKVDKKNASYSQDFRLEFIQKQDEVQKTNLAKVSINKKNQQ